MTRFDSKPGLIKLGRWKLGWWEAVAEAASGVLGAPRTSRADRTSSAKAGTGLRSARADADFGIPQTLRITLEGVSDDDVLLGSVLYNADLPRS